MYMYISIRIHMYIYIYMLRRLGIRAFLRQLTDPGDQADDVHGPWDQAEPHRASQNRPGPHRISQNESHHTEPARTIQNQPPSA